MKKIIGIVFSFFFCLVIMASDLLAKASEDWKEHKGYHFIIYYKDVPPDFIKSVEETAELYYQEITRNLGFTRYTGWAWEDRAKIYIYANADDYVAAAKAGSWSHGAADWVKKEIHTYPAANGFFDSLLPHELGHIIFREFVGANPYIPRWLDEGVAMYQEKAKRWGVNQTVKKAIEENRFISLRDLSTINLQGVDDTTFINLFYDEAASVVYYLVTELGQFKFADFCRDLKAGKTLENALSSTYMRFKNLDELNNAWMDYLKR